MVLHNYAHFNRLKHSNNVAVINRNVVGDVNCIFHRVVVGDDFCNNVSDNVSNLDSDHVSVIDDHVHSFAHSKDDGDIYSNIDNLQLCLYVNNFFCYFDRHIDRVNFSNVHCDVERDVFGFFDGHNQPNVVGNNVSHFNRNVICLNDWHINRLVYSHIHRLAHSNFNVYHDCNIISNFYRNIHCNHICVQFRNFFCHDVAFVDTDIDRHLHTDDDRNIEPVEFRDFVANYNGIHVSDVDGYQHSNHGNVDCVIDANVDVFWQNDMLSVIRRGRGVGCSWD